MNRKLTEEEENKRNNQFFPTTQGKRFLNYLLDLIFLYIFAYVLGFVLMLFGFYSLIENLSNTVGGIIIAMIFYTTSENLWSKTPAKFITKTRVIMENGEKPELKTILVRSIIRFVPLEAFSFFGSNRPRGWHDEWSKTIVIDDKLIENQNHSKEISTDNLQTIKKNKMKTIKKAVYCKRCGYKLEKNSGFCSKCGTKI